MSYLIKNLTAKFKDMDISIHFNRNTCYNFGKIIIGYNNKIRGAFLLFTV